jgi:hypothetical protein
MFVERRPPFADAGSFTMPRITRTALAAIGIVLLVLTFGTFDHSSRLDAYTLKSAKWYVSQVPYYINPANRDMTTTAAESAIKYAATNWSAQTTARIMFYYMGRTTDTSTGYNKKNIVVFRNSTNGESAASAYYWSSLGKLLDFDIVVWDSKYTFNPDGACSGSRVYLQDVMTHEFGHALGLGHSSVREATMYPSVTWCQSTLRSLASDDKAGVQKLYP